MTSPLPLALIVTLCCVTFDPAAAANPGVKAMVTKKGIDYANALGKSLLNTELRRQTLPNPPPTRSGRSTAYVYNIQITSVTLPSMAMNLSPSQNGLTWSLRNLGVNLKAGWTYKYKRGWFRWRKSGTIYLYTSGVSASVTLRLGKDAWGRPTVSAASCSASVPNFRVKIRGGLIGWIINLFRGTIGRRLKAQFTPKICQSITKVINSNGARALQRMKVTSPLLDGKFVLDYKLTDPPTVTSAGIAAGLKGGVYWASNRREPPFSPRAVTASQTSRMLHLWLTDFPVNSMAWAAHTNGFLQRTLKEVDLPSDKRNLLAGTCLAGQLCIGDIIPQLNQSSAYGRLTLTARSRDPPKLTLNTNAATLNAPVLVEVLAANKDKLISLGVNVSMTLNPSIRNDLLVATISRFILNLEVVSSILGGINSAALGGLNQLLNTVISVAVVPRLNVLGLRGLPLPLPGDVTMVSPSLAVREGYMLLSTDVRYK